jgi:hypothetical protein
MKKGSFFTNKFTISVLILLACLVTDIALHRRMSRVIIPSQFTSKRMPQNFVPCDTKIKIVSKHWIGDINSIDALNDVTEEAGGFKSDIYFNDTTNVFTLSQNVNIDSFFSAYAIKKLQVPVWLSISDLDSENNTAAVKMLSNIRKRYNLFDKIIITSASAKELNNFCDSGFFTGYQLPDFNPYLISEDSLINYIDIISANLKKTSLSSIACNYFQYPVVTKFFPNFPVLTWTDKSNISLVSHYFNSHMENDDQIKLVLYPY